MKKHKDIISPGEILILGFGLGPIIISLILCFLFLFFPNKANLFYILIVGFIFLLMLFIGRGDIFKGREILKYLKGIKNIEKDISLIIAVVSIVMVYIFIVGINFPIVTHDASTYAFYGKHLYQEKNLSNYPLKKPDEEIGASHLGVRHPPGFPLIYTWFYLLQGNTNSDILPRTVSPMYGLYLIILLWIVLKTRKNKYCGAFAILLMALTPLFAQQSFNNTIDPIRIFFIFLSFILFAKFLRSESFILALLTAIIAGLSFFIHTGGLLVLPVMIILYLLLSKKSVRRRVILAVLLAIVLGGVQYGIKHAKISHPIGRSYLSLFSLKTFGYSRQAKIATFGSKWANEIDKGEVSRLRIIFRERLQGLSQVSIFGLSYYVFIITLFYWIGYIRKKKLDLVLLLGAILYGIPVIYKYYLNYRYISAIQPIMIYFGGLALGDIYGRLKKKRLWRIPTIIWLLLFIGIMVKITALFIPASLFDSNYTKIGSFKKTVRYIFASQKKKLYTAHPRFKAIEYINTKTPRDSIVLVFRTPEYFYNAKRKGIYYRDTRVKGFYRIHDTGEAYEYLSNLGVDYIIVDPLYEEGSIFKKSEFENILKDKELSRLVFGDYVKVYKLRYYTIRSLQ